MNDERWSTFHDDDGYGVCDHRGDAIARVTCPDKSRCGELARMIAALPDLLRACGRAARAYHHPACRASRGRDVGDRCTCYIGQCREAHKRAEEVTA